jgi:hypothetical protein
MIINKIISLANEPTQLALLAMVRSLRATGCHLPVWVIPFDERRFELPEGCEWWEIPEVVEWLEREAAPGHAKKVMRKYQCLLESNYLFVDSDVIFLKNPQVALSNATGFTTFCCHWADPRDTTTKSSLPLYQERSTTWQRWVFNSGQFACDARLYDLAGLIKTAESSEAIETCLNLPYHEQPGFNLLVLLSASPINNLTLPPTNLESSWAGHYSGAKIPSWRQASKKPFLLHWAGRKCDGSQAVDELMLGYLSPTERLEFLAKMPKPAPLISKLRVFASDLLRGMTLTFSEHWSRKPAL